MLADKTKQPITAKHDETGLSIRLPDELPDEGVSIIVAEIEGEPVVDTTIRQHRDGSVVLRAIDANIHGASPRYEGGKKDHIGYWADPKDSISWKFRIDKSGTFDVLVSYSCAPGAAGSKFVVSVDEQNLDGETKETGAWDIHKIEKLGTVKLKTKGEHTLRIQPSAQPAWKSMGANRVILKPVE